MENIGLGLELMVVGMSTVFLILIIVIYGGKLLIQVLNRVAPEEVLPAKKAQATHPTAIDGTTMEVLREVVSQITGGKGKLAAARKS